jgi:protein-disulfide isomerase
MPTTPSFKTYGLIAGGILLLGLGVFGLEQLAFRDRDHSDIAVTITDTDTKVTGNAAAIAQLVEYSDFQCPACASYAPLVEQLRHDFPDTLRVAYRHFPLTAIHQNAMISAQAAEAAHQQGKFWEMSALLFAHQTDWDKSETPKDFFRTYAQNLDLDLDRFDTDIDRQDVIVAVLADKRLGNDADIPGTPTFFLNGKPLKNIRDYADLKTRVTEALTQTR